jgi:hypothetical protein
MTKATKVNDSDLVEAVLEVIDLKSNLFHDFFDFKINLNSS